MKTLVLITLACVVASLADPETTSIPLAGQNDEADPDAISPSRGFYGRGHGGHIHDNIAGGGRGQGYLNTGGSGGFGKGFNRDKYTSFVNSDHTSGVTSGGSGGRLNKAGGRGDYGHLSRGGSGYGSGLGRGYGLLPFAEDGETTTVPDQA